MFSLFDLLLLFIVVVMLRMDWRLALVTFAVLPLVIVATMLFRQTARECYRRQRVAISIGRRRICPLPAR